MRWVVADRLAICGLADVSRRHARIRQRPVPMLPNRHGRPRTLWPAEANQSPKWQDAQRVNRKMRMTASVPGCASHCNEGNAPTPRRLGPHTRGPSIPRSSRQPDQRELSSAPQPHPSRPTHPQHSTLTIHSTYNLRHCLSVPRDLSDPGSTAGRVGVWRRIRLALFITP